MSENRGRMKTVQKNHFVALMAKVVEDRLLTDMSPIEQKDAWLRVTNFLNYIGPAKTLEQWKRCWTDIKSTVKEKSRRNDKKMTKVDLKVVAIMNKERRSANAGLRDVGLRDEPSSNALDVDMQSTENNAKEIASSQLNDERTSGRHSFQNFLSTVKPIVSATSVQSQIKNSRQPLDERVDRRESVKKMLSQNDLQGTVYSMGLNDTYSNSQKRPSTIIGDIDPPRKKAIASISFKKTSAIEASTFEKCRRDLSIGLKNVSSEHSSKIFQSNRASTDIESTPRKKRVEYQSQAESSRQLYDKLDSRRGSVEQTIPDRGYSASTAIESTPRKTRLDSVRNSTIVSLHRAQNQAESSRQVYDDRGSVERTIPERRYSASTAIESTPRKTRLDSIRNSTIVSLHRAQNQAESSRQVYDDRGSVERTIPERSYSASVDIEGTPRKTRLDSIRNSTIVSLHRAQNQAESSRQVYDDRGSVERTIPERSYSASVDIEGTQRKERLDSISLPRIQNQAESSRQVYDDHGSRQTIEQSTSSVSGHIETPRTKTAASTFFMKKAAATSTTKSITKLFQRKNLADLDEVNGDAIYLPHDQKMVSVTSSYGDHQMSTVFMSNDDADTQLSNYENVIQNTTGDGLSFLRSMYASGSPSHNAEHPQNTDTFVEEENDFGSPTSRQSDDSFAGNVSSAYNSDGEDSMSEGFVYDVVRGHELASTGRSNESTFVHNSGRGVPQTSVNARGRGNRSGRGGLVKVPSLESVYVDSGREDSLHENPTRGHGRGRGKTRGRGRQQYQERRPSKPLSTLADNSVKMQREGTDLLYELKRQNDVIIEQNKELIQSAKDTVLHNRAILALLRE